MKYPRARGSNLVGIEGAGQAQLVETSQFQALSAHLVLDLTMGIQAQNRLHCIGEKLGLHNENIIHVWNG